jgi:endonuclease YncB( thermonuclease family)
MDVTGTRATTHTIAIQRARSTLRRSLHTMINIRRQPYGAISTAALREITQGQQLVLVFDDVDKYGRIVVQAWVGNLDVNAEMVRRGAAWFESEWSDDNRCEVDQHDLTEARCVQLHVCYRSARVVK